jgi:hypothetical protein
MRYRKFKKLDSKDENDSGAKKFRPFLDSRHTIS